MYNKVTVKHVHVVWSLVCNPPGAPNFIYLLFLRSTALKRAVFSSNLECRMIRLLEREKEVETIVIIEIKYLLTYSPT